MSDPTIHQASHEHVIGEDVCELLESHGVLWGGEYWTLGPGVIEPVDSFRVFSIACMALLHEMSRQDITPRLTDESGEWRCKIWIKQRPGDGYRDTVFRKPFSFPGPTALAALLAAHGAAREAK